MVHRQRAGGEGPDADPAAAGEASPPDPAESAACLALELRTKDLEDQVQALRDRERWHFLWAVVGISPAAAVPALGLLFEGSLGLLVILGFLVTLTQGISWARASRDAEALEKELEALRKEKGG